MCGIEFDRKDIAMNKMVATTLEAKFYVFDVRTQHPKKGFAHLTEKVGHIQQLHLKTVSFLFFLNSKHGLNREQKCFTYE